MFVMWRDILSNSLVVAAVYCILLFILHIVVFTSSRLSATPKEVTRADKNIEISNRAVATFHATFMFYLTIYYWLKINPNVVIIEHTAHESFCLDVMMGYLWYDITIELIFTRQLDTLGHHLLGLASHLSSRLSANNAAAFYSMLVFIAEGSTPFLHSSWFLHSRGQKNTKLFMICAGLLLLTFFVFRIILSSYMLFHLTKYRDAWGDENFILFVFNFLIVALFSVLNFFWFYKLVKMATSNSKKETRKNE